MSEKLSPETGLTGQGATRISFITIAKVMNLLLLSGLNEFPF